MGRVWIQIMRLPLIEKNDSIAHKIEIIEFFMLNCACCPGNVDEGSKS
ncbi:MAG: hypothetical protein O8C65_08020 [Candidatus Methanoperedens sp.]|nr:hypothetical protein [Candidatus Methanoperedens sp.]